MQHLLHKQVATLRIILLSMMSGPAMFFGIALVLRNQFPPGPYTPFLTYGAIGLSMVLVLSTLVVPDMFIQGSLRSLRHGKESPLLRLPQYAGLDDTGKYGALFQTRWIARCALLEAAAMLCVLAFMLEGQIVAPFVALVMLTLIAVPFPSTHSIEQWIEEQRGRQLS